MKEQTIRNILAEELFGSRICESVEDQEILEYFYKKLTPIFEKFLWGEPISVPELRKLLRKNIVNFEFIKLDGHVRPAKGTTMMKYIPKDQQPKGIRPSSDMVATFWDMEKDAWRSVSKRSKEIVLKKDEEKNRPVVVVKDKDEKLKKVGGDADKLGPEPVDELQVGDVRNYLNRNGRNIGIEITRIDDDGSVFARTLREKTPFKVPAARVQNIGEIIPPEEIQNYLRRPKYRPQPAPQRAPQPYAQTSPTMAPAPPPTPEEPEMKPVTPTTPEGPAPTGSAQTIELVPREEEPPEEPPEEEGDEAEELER
jgi:hypothetical protein